MSALGIALMVVFASLGVVAPTAAGAATAPAFVQTKTNDIGSGTKATVAFTNANTAGNLIAVYVVWDNTGGVTVTDSRSNTYTAASPRTTWQGSWSAQVFYAKNIAAGTNTVTTTFATGITSFGLVYVHEYSGLDKTNPVDVTASAIGSAAAMSSGAVTTTNANDLLFGAGASTSTVNAVGTGFTSRSTAFGNRTEDRVVSAVGSYAATATQNGSGWVMQLVAFRSASNDTTPPTVPTGVTPTAVSPTQINVNWTASTDDVGVTGYKIFRNGTQVGTSTTTSYSDTGLTPNTPYSYTVSAFDAAGNDSGQSTPPASTATLADTTGPTVAITAPAGGATVSGSVTVSANASDNVAVASVQFLLDGNALGSPDTTSPYSISWDTSTATNGAHTLTARATDTSGNPTTSAPVSVTVQTDTTVPTVAITAPAGGATVSGPVTVSANASDNVAVANVQFLLDGNALGSPDTTSPYSISWDTTAAANGAHTLTARATDTSGNVATSAPVSVTVSNTQTAPPPAFVQTNVNSVGSGTKATVAFNSANTAGNLIAVYVVWDNPGAVTVTDSHNNTYAAASARTTWQGSWSAQVFYAKNIAAGANTVTATFATGITSFGLVYVHEYSGLDKTNPVDVSAGAIGSAAAMSSGAVTTTFANDLLFGAGASTSTVSAVGTGFTSRSTAFGNRTEDRLVSAVGSYAATATQNGSGWVMQLVAFRSATASNDTTAPNVAITAPAGGATVSGSVTVSANASDNVAVGGVQFLLDGNALGSQDTTTPYSISWDTTAAANGVHTLTARATDTSGNVATSAPVSVTVSNAVSGPSAPPVAAYGFNEGTGTTTADSSGNGLTGTLVNGATWAPGKYGNAVSLDGVNDLVDLGSPPALQFTSSMTISGWINPATFPTDDAVIVSKKTIDGLGYQLDTTQDSGSRTVGFKLTNSSGADMIRYGATPLQANTWYHVAGVYNATSQTMDVYLNGVLDDGAQVGTVTSTQQTSTANVNIGQRAGAYSFAGLIDEVRLYGRALTGPEIQTDMNTPIGNSWASYFGNNRSGWAANENGFNPTTAANLHLAWKATDTGPDHGVFSQPAVVNGTVYWGSFDGYERATDTSGNLRWQTFLGDTHDPTCTDPSQAGVVSTATVRSDVPIGSATSVLYVGGGDTRMYALNAATGAVLWSTLLGQNPDHYIWSSPLVFGNSVYIGMSSFGTCPDVQGQLVQLDRVTGAIQHTFNAVPNGCVGGGVWSSPTIDAAAGTIYVGTGNQDPCANGTELAPAVVELHASDLSLVGSWTLPLNQQPNNDSDFGATPTLFNGTIGGQSTALVGLVNKNGVFYAFKRDALTAGPVWSTRIADGGDDPNIGTGDVGTAAYDGSTLYVAGDINNTLVCDGTVNALNPSTGQFIWRHCFTGGFPLGGATGASGGVIAVGEGKNIVVVNAATGATVFTFAGAGMFVGAPSIVNGTLYEGDMAGNLYALKP